MVGKLLGLILTLLVVHNVQCEDPPVVEGSYIAWGEIVQPVEDTDDGVFMQMAFEESYDASSGNSAFFIWMSGKNLTFIKNSKTNQTFFYTETDDKKIKCKEATEKEWMVSDIAPGLMSYEDDDGTVKFSLTQLFNIPKKYLNNFPQGVPGTYREIPSKEWTYEIKDTKKVEDKNYETSLGITAYWSGDDRWNTSAGQRMTPLGFNVSKITWSDPPLVEDYVINVFGFVPGAYDHKFFKAVQGVVCETRKSTRTFPNVKNIKAIALHSEMAIPTYQELRNIDTWFDPGNQMVRIDVERFRDENPMEVTNKHYQSEIAIGKMEVVFRWGYYKGESDCVVIPFDKYENDMQNFVDVTRNMRRWHMGMLFGLNDTSYAYIGKTTKNDIPCHLFQGKRTDWPDKKSKIESLWEWCFNVNMSKPGDIVMFQDGEFGLISADVVILSHPNPGYINYRLSHHFYEVAEQDPQILDAMSFDIGKCFKDTEKRLLQFFVDLDIGEDNIHLAENATSDVTFLQKWKAAIYEHSELPPYSLRVSDVRATIDDHSLVIKFALLGIHNNLTDDIKKGMMKSFEAEQNFRKKVNDGLVFIRHVWNRGKTPMNMTAMRHSVNLQMNTKFEPRTLPPPPPTTTELTTRFKFSLRTREPTEGQSTPTGQTDDINNTGSTPPTPSGKETTSPVTETPTGTPKVTDIVEEKFEGHGPGAVAGVSIAMLLVGITIGASGTFYKFNGLPAGWKR